MSDQASQNTTKPTKIPRHRSPNYPVIGLQKAIEQTRILYDRNKRHLVPIAVAHQHLGYKPMSSSGKQCVAALKAYGMIEIEGKDDKQQIRVSERARRILLNDPERDQLLRAASLSPTLHAELWKRYGDEGLPADDVLCHYLIFERNFNEAVVDTFIKRFKATLSFAKLRPISEIEEEDEEDIQDESDNIEEGDTSQRTIQSNTGTSNPNNSKPISVSENYKDFPLYLNNNQKAYLYIPTTLSKTDLELLKIQLNHSLIVIEATSVVEDDDEL